MIQDSQDEDENVIEAVKIEAEADKHIADVNSIFAKVKEERD